MAHFTTATDRRYTRSESGRHANFVVPGL